MIGRDIGFNDFHPAVVFPVAVLVEVDTDGKEPVNEAFFRGAPVNILKGFNPGVLEKIAGFVGVPRQFQAEGVELIFVAIHKDIAQLKLTGLAAGNYRTII